MRRTIFVGTGLLLLALLSFGTAMAQQGDPTKGKETWAARNCKSCHGDNGEGKYAGPRAGDGLTVQQWVNQARNPRSQMPTYRTDQVSDQDIADMNAFMQTLPKPASFTPITYTAQPGDLPGKVLFNQKRCAACHADGTAFVKSRFTDQGRAATNDAVLKQLRTPAQRMPMFRPNQVSDDEAGQIAAFFRTLQPAAPAAQPAAPGALPRTGEADGGPLAGWLFLGGLGALLLGAGTLYLARLRA